MQRRLTGALALAVVISMALFMGSATAQEKTHVHTVFLPTAIVWKDGPASLPPGAKFAVLEGDPTKPGLFTMRLWFPAGYQIAPHWHPAVERVTVIAGTLHLGKGETFDKAQAPAQPAGTFGFMEAKTPHFGWAEGETIVQLTGEGPWGITYVNPADDPRGAKKSEK